MGPFKHSVDDGLDLRKSAFECMYTLLGTCLDRLDVFEFLRHLEDGLRDHFDIKMLTYLMCARLAQLCPAVVLQSECQFSVTMYFFMISVYFIVGVADLIRPYCLLTKPCAYYQLHTS